MAQARRQLGVALSPRPPIELAKLGAGHLRGTMPAWIYEKPEVAKPLGFAQCSQLELPSLLYLLPRYFAHRHHSVRPPTALAQLSRVRASLPFR